MRFRFITAFLILFAGYDLARGADELHIFLKPGISAGGEALTLGDICAVEGNSFAAESVMSAVLTKEIYSDGYIDRTELRLFLKDKTPSLLFIYGSGVRIEQGSEKKSGAEAGYAVKSGRKITALFERNLIRIEQQVTAVKSGRLGEVIPVRLKTGRVISARIIDSERVFVE